MISRIEIPKAYICPLTDQLMDDPVLVADGHIFERKAIAGWLKNSNKNPITQIMLDHKKLAPHLQLKEGIDTFKKNNNIGTNEAFFTAMLTNKAEEMEKLPYFELHLEANDKDGNKPLHLAAMKGYINSILWLLKQKVNINSRGHQRAALHWACVEDQLEAAIILIDNHADIEIQALDLATPLHEAASQGHNNIIRLLINRSGNIEAKTAEGCTPLHLAVRECKVESVIFLLNEAHANIEATDHDGRTPLHYAAKSGDIISMQVLLAAKPNINARDKQGRRPLHLAAEGGYNVQRLRYPNKFPEVIKCLLDNGANHLLQDNLDLTPAELARRYRQLDLSHLIIDHKHTLERELETKMLVIMNNLQETVTQHHTTILELTNQLITLVKQIDPHVLQSTTSQVELLDQLSLLKESKPPIYTPIENTEQKNQVSNTIPILSVENDLLGRVNTEPNSENQKSKTVTAAAIQNNLFYKPQEKELKESSTQNSPSSCCTVQ